MQQSGSLLQLTTKPNSATMFTGYYTHSLCVTHPFDPPSLLSLHELTYSAVHSQPRSHILYDDALCLSAFLSLSPMSFDIQNLFLISAIFVPHWIISKVSNTSLSPSHSMNTESLTLHNIHSNFRHCSEHHHVVSVTCHIKQIMLIIGYFRIFLLLKDSSGVPPLMLLHCF